MNPTHDTHSDLRHRAAPARWRVMLAAAGGWPRRLLAVGCLLGAAASWSGARERVSADAPRAGPAPGVPVVVAAHDLAAGAVVGAADVRSALLPRDVVPSGALRAGSVEGRVVAGPVRRGEPLTDVRVLGPGLTAGLRAPDTVATPVRLADGQTAALLRTGDRIDLYAVPVDTVADAGSTPAVDQGGGEDQAGAPAAGSAADRPGMGATLVAAGVRVLAVLPSPGASAEDGALIVVATSDQVARRLTVAVARQRLSVALRPP
jgi:pilus assembly protein CpaB